MVQMRDTLHDTCNIKSCNYLCKFENEKIIFFTSVEHLTNSLMIFLDEAQNGKTYVGMSSQISILHD